jgi:hypothetical protein
MCSCLTYFFLVAFCNHSSTSQQVPQAQSTMRTFPGRSPTYSILEELRRQHHCCSEWRRCFQHPVPYRFTDSAPFRASRSPIHGNRPSNMLHTLQAREMRKQQATILGARPINSKVLPRKWVHKATKDKGTCSLTQHLYPADGT